jgi:hypothetical protein
MNVNFHIREDNTLISKELPNLGFVPFYSIPIEVANYIKKLEDENKRLKDLVITNTNKCLDLITKASNRLININSYSEEYQKQFEELDSLIKEGERKDKE